MRLREYFRTHFMDGVEPTKTVKNKNLSEQERGPRAGFEGMYDFLTSDKKDSKPSVDEKIDAIIQHHYPH